MQKLISNTIFLVVFGLNFGSITDAFDKTEIVVVVEGVVNNPGRYKFKHGAILRDLLNAANGVKRLGRKECCVLVSGIDDQLSFTLINATSNHDLSIPLRDGDRLFIGLRD